MTCLLPEFDSSHFQVLKRLCMVKICTTHGFIEVKAVKISVPTLNQIRIPVQGL